MAKTSSRGTSKKFVFRKHATIGAADAIDDKEHLLECFVDNGELDILLNVKDPICTVLGRTGSGKTALLEMINVSQDRSIRIEPEGLALTYISSNGVLRFFSEAGVNMDLFYRLLWRHVFAVELLRKHYQIVNEDAQKNFLQSILERFSRDRSKREAIEYLQKWGENFWKESEYRVQEITQTLVKDLRSSVGGQVSGEIPILGKGGIELTAEHARSLTDTQRGEVVRYGQEVVNRVQIKTLSEIMQLLERDLLDDKQKRYYITIDRLDENWVHDDFRYHLIKALLDTVRDFNQAIENVKIIVAIREDLLDRVFRFARGPGYQEEKYRSMYLMLSWQRQELEQLLNLRVNHLIREQYTTQPVNLRDLFPKTIQQNNDPIKYFLDRTMYRPRDCIMFFNECMSAATGKTKLTQTIVLQAEGTYSQNRLRALADEWAADYPNIIELSFFLKRLPPQFRASDLEDDIGQKMLNFLTANPSHPHDQIYHLMMNKFESDDWWGFIQEILKILYKVGVIGIKPERYTSVQWAHFDQKLFVSEINREAIVHIHPAFWRVLGVILKK